MTPTKFNNLAYFTLQKKWIHPPNCFTEYSVGTKFFEFSVIPTEFNNLSIVSRRNDSIM